MIGYLGPKGSHTYCALQQYLSYHDQGYKETPYLSIHGLFHALSQEEVHAIFVPIENSYGGDVFSAFEGLTQLQGDYFISSELIVPIHQALMAKEKVAYRDIKQIYAHEQSIRQCSKFIQKYLSHASVRYCASNSAAAQCVISSDVPSLCLGNKIAAELYNLELLEDSIQDSSDNTTRFIVISKEQPNSTGLDKTSIVFSALKDQPGSLCDSLLDLSQRSINLTRISSRPTKTVLGEYLFFVDCEGHINDSLIAEALEGIKQKSSYFKFLGSYPREKLQC